MRRLIAILSACLALSLTLVLIRSILDTSSYATAELIATQPSSVSAPSPGAVQPAAATSKARILLPLVSKVTAPTATPTRTTNPTSQPAPTTIVPGIDGIKQLPVGQPGFSDVGTRQVIRTRNDRVYIFAPEIYRSLIRAFRANDPGTPGGFTEVAAESRPNAGSPIWSVDVAIDAQDVAHLLYIVESGPVVYQTFDTKTDGWGVAEQIINSAWPDRNNGLRQGSGGVSIGLDSQGVPHVVYGKTAGDLRRVYYNNRSGGKWSNEQLVDDQADRDNSHAVLAFAPDETLYVVWLVEGSEQGKGTVRVRARRGGSWEAAREAGSDAFTDATYSVDQGPGLIVTPDGAVHTTYVGGYEQVPGTRTGYEYGRAYHRYSNDGGKTWDSDDPPLLYTHNPALATDAQGNLYMFGHREYWKTDRCASMLVNVKTAGGGWDEWRTLANGCYDSSVSARWAQYHWNNPTVLDVIYWTEKGPNGESDLNILTYAEIRGGVDTVKKLSSTK